MASMAPTLKPEQQSFSGDEFSNNVFSDLAPLLTLFGEQVTKQFLSMSMGWADNILLAMGPLGILTTVVSAIRVSGVKSLKSLVGRARENLATAEQELLSSTSNDVCEMWTGTDIVRQLGKPKTMELILIKGENNSQIPKVVGLKEAIEDDFMRNSSSYSFMHNTRKYSFVRSIVNVYFFVRNIGYMRSASKGMQMHLKLTAHELASQAPNLALNSEGSLSPQKELWFWAAVGIVLQLAAVIFPALTTYLWKFPKATSSVRGYAYPCFAAGTLAVVFGVILCSHVVEGITHERTLEPTDDRVLQVTRLQRACTVSDQIFQPFLIINSPNNKQIRTSRRFVKPTRRLRRQLSKLTVYATILTLLGFVFQFVGLRGLHWSATIFQFGVTLVMTGARSWVRRGFSTKLPCMKLEPGYELERTALLLSTYPSGVPHYFAYFDISGWEIMTGWGYSRCLPPEESSTEETESHLPSLIESALSIRRDLAQLMPDTRDRDEVSEATSKLVSSMEKILDCYEQAIQNGQIQVENSTLDHRLFEWNHHATYLKNHVWRHETVSCCWGEGPPGINKENQSRLELILRLCMCSFGGFEWLNQGSSVVVVGHGDMHKCTELEGWLGAEKIYSLGSGEDELIYEGEPKLSHILGISTLSFPLTFVSSFDYFASPLQPMNSPQLLALELFSGFMNSLAKSVKAFGGSTKFFGRHFAEGRSTPIKQNSVLLSFSQVLVDCGLVETIDDANIFVIPPFLNRRLLPTECGDATFDEPVLESSTP